MPEKVTPSIMRNISATQFLAVAAKSKIIFSFKGPPFYSNSRYTMMTTTSSEMVENPNTRRKKSVSWSTHGTLIPIDISDNDAELVWYDHCDYIAFKKDCQMTMLMSRATTETLRSKRGKSKSLDMYCELGLEFVIDSQRKMLRRRRREKAREVVLGEQYDQQLDGLCCPEFIADLYKDISIPSHNDAHQRGLEVEREIRATDRVSPEPVLKTESTTNVMSQIFSVLPRGKLTKSKSARRMRLAPSA